MTRDPTVLGSDFRSRFIFFLLILPSHTLRFSTNPRNQSCSCAISSSFLLIPILNLNSMRTNSSLLLLEYLTSIIRSIRL
ncbi:hypothetical protein HanRHA438_Chr12g0560111 [Helianthus annuus]|uniref:Uncharacterized protein n=1 Tax=Helianthus annuus TaxID=4232 RepID=A0A251T6I7_HELAN|nr:hypothetical protein HanXRQr2_Chr12g0548701 [Helianthus annuus]KAJ0489934.1 hypothetical protein HanHA300_Chr12g0449611 [Helianthus annuus]KAJ0493969.1 hypothetical protein HanIR_Chr12g0592071 [Helianthus annuus]KAJ0505844.1 hypothetical protein HanHA89_Chr12g0475101 [Helianthus annuus]KAJ0675518.1 hypothetical protein HanLR1_Chr12g0452071 [Helianthus annuus]